MNNSITNLKDYRDSGEACPLCLYLKEKFTAVIESIRNDYAVGDSIAVCNILCPKILGYNQHNSKGMCAIRLRLIGGAPIV